ncbi:MAG: hypothetical protein IKX39_02545 [Muribaculaceae bacterium]|nr:hypothetical protein [Muribaculaceae bacterium]
MPLTTSSAASPGKEATTEMGLIRRYRTALARHHRSRGFGIHSPSAYRFVTEVLREPCHYYAYDQLRTWRKRLLADGVRPMMSNHEAQLLFRVANHFAPQNVWQVGHGGILPLVTLLLTSSKTQVYIYDPLYQPLETRQMLGEHFDTERIHLMSDLTPPFKGAGGNFILVNSSPDGEDDQELLGNMLGKCLVENETIVILRNLHRNPAMKRLWRKTKAMMTYGQTFTNEKTAILVARPGIPREDFTLWL